MHKHPQLILVGQRIRELRQQRGYSQEAFSLEAGIARGYFGGVERGERNLAALNLIRIAEVLGVEVGELFPPTKQLDKARSGKKLRSGPK